jgi:hypothetical protein
MDEDLLKSNIINIFLEENVKKMKTVNKKKRYSLETINKFLSFGGYEDKLSIEFKKVLSKRLFTLGSILNDFASNQSSDLLSEDCNNKLKHQMDLYKDDIDNINKCVGYWCKQQKGGGIFADIVFRENVGTFGKILDVLQLIVDIVGLIPFPPVGMTADVIGVILSLIRKDWLGAVFSAIGIIPFVGSFIGNPLKYGVKIFKGIRKGSKVGRRVSKFRNVKRFRKGVDRTMDTYDRIEIARDTYDRGPYYEEPYYNNN